MAPSWLETVGGANPQKPRRWTIVYICIASLFVLVLYTFTTSIPTKVADKISQYTPGYNPDGLLDTNVLFTQMWKETIPVNASTYRPWNGFEYNLTEGVAPAWNEPLGEDLCIIDMDSRAWDEPGYLWSSTPMSWTKNAVSGQSAGVLSHWMYAKIHGYKYYYVNITEPWDRRSSWMKPPVISKILQDHKVCIYLDSDALFHHPELPMEWLFNYWSIQPNETSLTLAEDPASFTNTEMYGNYWKNTGFLVFQNTTTSHEMMKDWWDCPSKDSKYPGCDQYKFNKSGKPTDQAGFGLYIRPEYKDHIKELSCKEANGYMGSGTSCEGTFITHVWTGKRTWLNQYAGEQMPGPWLESLHTQYLAESDSFFIEQEELLGDEFRGDPTLREEDAEETED